MSGEKKNRSGAQKKRARQRRLEREAEWHRHFGPECPGRDVTWSSVSPPPNKR